MYFIVFLFVFLFLLSNAFLTLDEETLIILSSFVWVDAAGGLFKKLLDAELVAKVSLIRSKFTWFLNLKRQLLVDLIRLHKTRLSLKSSFYVFNNLFVTRVVGDAVSLFLFGVDTRRKFDSRVRIVNFGIMVHYDRLVRNIVRDAAMASFSETLVQDGESYIRRFNVVRYTTILFLFV
jgi:hypothetical protein